MRSIELIFNFLTPQSTRKDYLTFEEFEEFVIVSSEPILIRYDVIPSTEQLPSFLLPSFFESYLILEVEKDGVEHRYKDPESYGDFIPKSDIDEVMSRLGIRSDELIKKLSEKGIECMVDVPLIE
ncbi:MAG: hypothetical protein QGF74_03290 [Candidatus Nanoarchaeia archaeon]|jgi:hypothetical protein|nr:hypothetical protein [Candidatus Nanoarchaeia archaeon]|tara:strand:+ start:15342 stop:15716 length:375 start_codon:yes stop_codon:yes gene_type:complete